MSFRKKNRKSYHAYHSHKSDAKRRGIEFQFSIEDWLNWWESRLGPDWLEKRGNKSDQFVMARAGDTGPYAVWNVRCATNFENLSEAHLGVKKSDEHKKKIGLGNKGKIRTEETKKKISETRKRKYAEGTLYRNTEFQKL